MRDAAARTLPRLRGRRGTSICDPYVTRIGAASDLVAWFTDIDRDDYTRSMIAANPHHFLIDTVTDGRQEVVETTRR